MSKVKQATHKEKTKEGQARPIYPGTAHMGLKNYTKNQRRGTTTMEKQKQPPCHRSPCILIAHIVTVREAFSLDSTRPSPKLP